MREPGLNDVVMGEVLEGEAVFVRYWYDFVYNETLPENYIGKTGENVINDDDKKFDFVQELLNQVVPRKRSVTTYALLNENGIFDSDTEGAVRLLRTDFNIGWGRFSYTLIITISYKIIIRVLGRDRFSHGACGFKR